jgi:hypothetical protein
MMMKTHVEVQLRLSLNDGKNLHHALRQFANDIKAWTYLQKESEIYQNNIGGEGGYLVREQSKHIKPALVAIAPAKTKRSNTFYVANIAPRDCFELTIAEYNAIGLTFVRDFRKWLKKGSFNGTVDCTSANKTLADIIPGEKSRKLFERFLKCDAWNARRLTSHPSDIEKLDVFICALFRYGSEVHLDELERFLVADQKWSRADAAWIRTRVDTGLAVLRMNRRF